MRAAVQAGWAALAAGGTSLDAVEQAVRVLEDHEHFNAGRGAALTDDGRVEMDASIMEGDRLGCGAVAAVSRVANPVTLARRVLETPHGSWSERAERSRARRVPRAIASAVPIARAGLAERVGVTPRHRRRRRARPSWHRGGRDVDGRHHGQAPGPRGRQRADRLRDVR